jgi:hypothetical protein
VQVEELVKWYRCEVKHSPPYSADVKSGSIPPDLHTLSEHAQGLHLYDSWTVPPHTASGIEVSQKSCGRKNRMKFSISMLQKLLALSTNKAKKYFSCIRGNVFM